MLPACLALLVLWLAWRRCPALALAWCAVVLAGGIGALMVAWDAPALLLLPAGTGPVLRFLGLAVVVTLALLRPAPAASAAAVVFVVGLVHLPSLHYGFVNEDFDFARRVGAAELTGTLHGSWDPRGIVEPYLRPLVAASLALDHRLWGGRPPGYHLTSLLIFAAAGLVAVALLRRLGLSPRAALAGALFWLVHPLAASAAAWPNQRTDSLAAVFYLGALLTLLHPAFPRRRAAACLGLGVLALACKEMAVTLPFAAYAVVQTGLPPDARRGRRLALAALLLLVAAYTIVWTSIFPERLADRLHGESSWGANAGIGLRSLAALYTQLLVPSDYESWWNQPLDQRSWLVLAAGPLVALLAAALVRSSRSAHAWRLLLLGLAWPLLTVWPLLAIREVDLFRLGFLLCLGSGILVGALFAGFESRRLWLPVAVTTALILLWVPASIRSAAAWGPGGLMSRQLGLWRAHRGTTWWQGLTPEMQRLYYEQRGLEGHEQTLLEAPVRDAAPPSD